ncbi:MAG TPA: hypothetical protein VE152_11370, partial [Acidimicrobiales bacterium]|nr:hypothetical protein [Acidimicrobiales bacterium]
MLAYVFWHRPVATTSRTAYEADLVAFHRALAGARPRGLLGSSTLRVDGASWVAGTGPCYEDWYALASSAVLDDLNETAVGEACADAHRAVAAQVDHSA